MSSNCLIKCRYGYFCTQITSSKNKNEPFSAFDPFCLCVGGDKFSCLLLCDTHKKETNSSSWVHESLGMWADVGFMLKDFALTAGMQWADKMHRTGQIF